MDAGILSNIGNTPLVRLSRVIKGVRFRLFAKLESFNPGGSVKDRPALALIKHALESGEIGPGATVVESSSGNMGIGLAQACAYLGLRFVCVVDPKTTRQNIDILRAYGAQIDYVSEPDPVSGEFLQARIDRVKDILKSTENSFWPDQYSNIHNVRAHHNTMREIVDQAGGEVDYLFCAVSTCGTIRGCAEYVRDCNLATRIVAVDAVGSVIFGGKSSKRLVPGHGASVRPKLHRPELVDEYLNMTDLDCVVGCRRLVRSEAILAGGSSGAVIMAIDRLKETIAEGAVCVAVMADRGERYLDTIYSDNWVEEHFGSVSHLWEDRKETGRYVTMTYQA
jgi:cysteine synthase A